MKIEIKPFTEEMIPLAGKLLAQRHKRNRADFPLLPARFEDSRIAAKAVSALWEKKLKHGYAAFRDGKMIAYIIGEHTTQPWGRCGYIYLPGYALAEDENAALIQDLYARLGDDWVKHGVFSHGFYVSAADANIVEALFNIGFGKERVDAMLDLRLLIAPEVEEPAGVAIRRAGKGDGDHLGNLSHIIANALASAPYWHPTIPEDYPELKEGWSELADDKDWAVWLALENGEALGAAGFTEQKEADADMLAAPKTAYLSVAATKPESRGRGISAALFWRGLDQARKDGFEVCYTNWISPNLLASRYWTRFGFKDVSYRLSKRISPMISWTRI
jgi:GNAT superfamily N-acetyltransferase